MALNLQLQIVGRSKIQGGPPSAMDGDGISTRVRADHMHIPYVPLLSTGEAGVSIVKRQHLQPGGVTAMYIIS
jgi:hypothetical protein